MDSVRIEIPSLEVINNQRIEALARIARSLGATVERTGGGVTTYTSISNSILTYSMLNLDAVELIVSAGGEVLNYKVFVQVVLEDVIPDGISNRTYTDEDGAEVVRTWGEWIHPNCPAQEIDGVLYMSGYAHNAGYRSSEKPHKTLKGSEIIVLKNNGYVIKNLAEFKQIQTDSIVEEEP